MVSRDWRRGLAGFLSILFCAAITVARAYADTQTITTSGAPVVFAQLQSGTLTVRTWSRTDVAIDADQTINVRHIDHVPPDLPAMFTLSADTIETAEGPLILPPEPFLVQPFDPTTHDGVAVNGVGNITITIPNASPLLVARVHAGEISIEGYHGGTFFATLRSGMLRLNDVSGTGAFQVNSGRVSVRDSTFERVRARTGRGNMLFENCTARQIEATSLTGTIVYDNGGFEPGLARFESERGNIALGIARGGAQIDAHSGDGRVITEGSFQSGPVVTATSERGFVMYYNGSIRSHPNLRTQFPMHHEHPIPIPSRRPPGRFAFRTIR